MEEENENKNNNSDTTDKEEKDGTYLNEINNNNKTNIEIEEEEDEEVFLKNENDFLDNNWFLKNDENEIINCWGLFHFFLNFFKKEFFYCCKKYKKKEKNLFCFKYILFFEKIKEKIKFYISKFNNNEKEIQLKSKKILEKIMNLFYKKREMFKKRETDKKKIYFFNIWIKEIIENKKNFYVRYTKKFGLGIFIKKKMKFNELEKKIRGFAVEIKNQNSTSPSRFYDNKLYQIIGLISLINHNCASQIFFRLKKINFRDCDKKKKKNISDKNEVLKTMVIIKNDFSKFLLKNGNDDDNYVFPTGELFVNYGDYFKQNYTCSCLYCLNNN
jgi:hypothetical protein